MTEQAEEADAPLKLLSRFADGAEAVLKQRLAELAQNSQGDLSLHKLRRALRETELWLRRLEHEQCARAGLNLPGSGRLGSISKFRGRLDSAIARRERGQPLDMPRLIEQAQTLLERLSFTGD